MTSGFEKQAEMADDRKKDGEETIKETDSATDSGSAEDTDADKECAEGAPDADAEAAPDDSRTENSSAEPADAEKETAGAAEIPEGTTEPAKKKRHHWGILIFCLAVLALAGGAYYYGVRYSETHFLTNTWINGHDVSGMTAEQVKKILAQKAKEYTFTLSFRDGSQETLKGSSFDYEAAPDDGVDRVLASQDNLHWYRSFSEKSENTVEVNTEYDADKLADQIRALPELQEDHMVKPADAYITYDEDSARYIIVPETEGSCVVADVVVAAAQDAVKQEKESLDIGTLEDAYEEPQIRADDSDLISRKDGYNKLIAGSVTWDLPGGEKMTVDGKTTREWLSEDDNGNLYRDDDVWKDKITACVDEMASRVNSVGVSRSFDSTSAGTITVSGGDYGYSVNKSEEVEEVTQILEDGDVQERSPVYYTEEFADGSKINDGIGDTYIEANLSAQHVWIYVNGSMVCDTPCVSGNTSLGRGTPTGVFQILYKDTDVDLKGQKLKNGKYSYVSHVNYWMPFYGGCGFHDASWRSSFGGTIYRSNGSHGCVNLPSGIASTFYSYVQTGMPVVVYY